MTGLSAATFWAIKSISYLTYMVTTKRSLPILRKVNDVTLIYLAIMQARIAIQAPTGCQNDRAVRANI